MSTLKRPITPYISLDDANTQNFFTKKRIQKHLRRAGLINSNGDILTEVEYASRQKDVSIGRDNQRKLDDAIAEVLNDMAKEHWAYARDHMEDMKNNLMNQFRRIETQYRRRVQPITIRHTYDGRVQVESLESATNNQSNDKDKSIKPLTKEVPSIRSTALLASRRASQSLNIQHPTDHSNIEQKLNDLKNQLAKFDQRFSALERRANTVTSTLSLQRIEQRLTQLENFSHIINDQRLDRKSTKKPKPKEDSLTYELNSKELQAIMPYIEPLPTFDMFTENEWI